MDQVMIKPANVTIDELIRGYDYIIRHKMTMPRIFLQCIKTFINTKDIFTTILGYNFNRDFRKYAVPDRKFEKAR